MLPPIYKQAELHGLHGMHSDPVGISLQTPDGIVRFSLARAEARKIAELLTAYLAPDAIAPLSSHATSGTQSDKSSAIPSSDGSSQVGQ
ncbi:hypothetical protein [Aromatoleum aromaticum]|uniref:hypothetical protein n=1 Tax=Aromatoleum aromaticum TaxID=551760 RepID=UPI0014594B35|nr:hypothetical protein [Aromatoleum aromaticum]NMG56760.1 hypothetical protein [Aromatoleum aromaticum]